MDTRGVVLIGGLRKSQTDTIIDVRFGYSDVDTYWKEPTDKLMVFWEKEKKYNMVSNVTKNRIFSPLFLSVDGILGKEALVVLTNLSRPMVTKMEEPLSHAHGWVNIRIEIVVMILYSCMILVACIYSPMEDREPDQRSGSGLVLAQ